MQQSAIPVVNNLFILSRNINRTKNISKKIGKEAFNYITTYVDIQNPDNFFISQGNVFKINESFKQKYRSIVDLIPVKKTKYGYLFIEDIDKYLVKNGLFIGRFDTLKKAFTNRIADNVLQFNSYKNLQNLKEKNNTTNNQTLKQIGPNKIYKTKIDLFGRFCYHGYEIISEKEIDSYHYFVVKKTGKASENPIPTSSPIIRLKRIGKNGKIITIYKLRTMYPYSEYLQDYIFKNNNLELGGKFKNDGRISKIGSFMRKYWIDEIPMLINLIKGDVKIFGVRPLSQQYFDLYTEELKQLRTKFKPGLIPPYYADLPESFEDIQNSEQKYLLEYQKNPHITDLKYLFKALYNILIRCKRSK